MTTKQKQCLLTFLGYDTGGVDGIWGDKSRNALEACQEDLDIPVDGAWGDMTETAVLEAVYTYDEVVDASGNPVEVPKVETGTYWDDIQYFSRAEFACKCGKYCNGYPVEPDETMVRYADEIRRRLGKPIPVNSGIRCKTHNANVGGVSNSQHLYGTAADLGKPSGVTVAQMEEIAEEVMGDTGGIGTYSWGIHIDSRATKSRWTG